jgi:FdhD protein
MQALELRHQPRLSTGPLVLRNMLQTLPEKLQTQQPQFSATGGVHASALFTASGELLLLKEDVGRHNAMDKLIGHLLLNDQLARGKDSLVLVSGRASFELVQKALMADVPFLAAIGAPSSLAVQLAQRHGMTLAGFLRADGFNVYSGQERIIPG